MIIFKDNYSSKTVYCTIGKNLKMEVKYGLAVVV